MKIAIIGYGKMGHAVERAAISRGHEIVARIDVDNRDLINSDIFRSADAAIEFSTPATAFDNCRDAITAGVATVCGSTAWTDRLDEIRRLAAERGVSFIWSSNYSPGVNIFFRLNSYLAGFMNRFGDYSPSLEEIHHIHKLDHPSGTAVTLATSIADTLDRIEGWTENPDAPATLIPVTSVREGEVPGTHIINWRSAVDEITITHRAFSRDGFALGAVIAAEWIAANPGVHTIDEIFGS